MAVDDFDSREDLEAAVLEKFDAIYDGDMEWEVHGGRDGFLEGLPHLSEDALAFIEAEDASNFPEYADYGYGEGQEEPPEWLEELGWYDDDGEWHNPFWYH